MITLLEARTKLALAIEPSRPSGPLVIGMTGRSATGVWVYRSDFSGWQPFEPEVSEVDAGFLVDAALKCGAHVIFSICNRSQPSEHHNAVVRFPESLARFSACDSNRGRALFVASLRWASIEIPEELNEQFPVVPR